MENNTIEGFNAFVCFFDLLGTSKLFEDAEAADAKWTASNRVRYDALRMARIAEIIIDTLGKEPQGIANAKTPGAYVFSDSTFFVCPVETYLNGKAKTDNEGEFGSFLWDIADCQRRLMLEGVIVRGYVTIGKVFSGKHFLVGPAVCRAANGEKLIKAPFVAIDERVFLFLGEGYYRQYGWEANENDPFQDYYKMIKVDSITNLAFVNYMWDWWSVEQDGEKLFSEQKRLIEVEGPKTRKSAQKYLPLAVYHNQMASKIFPKNQKPRFCVSDEVLSLLRANVVPKYLDPEMKLQSLRKTALGNVKAEAKNKH